MGILYVVATPIGNLSDISQRALETLKSVDLILCEDSRTTQKLLNRFNIRKKTLSYHQHSKLNKVNYILDLLQQGKKLALVSEAGTPGISDPGNKLVDEINKFALSLPKGQQINIVPIPGPSALTAAASIAGLPIDKFLFLGFPPAKRKRKKFFQEVIDSKYPVVLYESPHRILKTLNELRIMNHELRIVVCRELTKLHETTYRGTVREVAEQLESDTIKGEFVVIIQNIINKERR